jgi:hypothetical protein
METNLRQGRLNLRKIMLPKTFSKNPSALPEFTLEVKSNWPLSPQAAKPAISGFPTQSATVSAFLVN